MSWGAEAASGAGDVGSAAGSAGSGASSLGSAAGSAGNGIGGAAGSGGSVYGQMADVGGNSASAAPSGFSINATGNEYTPNGWDPYTSSEIGKANASLADHGSVNSRWDNFSQGVKDAAGGAYDGYQKFEKGMNQSAPDAWKDRSWSNPGTYGYVYGKFSGLANSGGSNHSAPPVNTVVNYQQPENPYLRKRGY